MHRSYYVDYHSNSGHPTIGVTSVEKKEDVQTFSEAKAEIIRHAQDLIDHWRGVIRAARQAKKADTDKAEDER